MMLLALVLTMMGVSDAMAQKIYRAELDKSMCKAWTSNEPGATVVEEPAAIDVSDENPNGTPFSCDNNLYKEIGSWSGIFGSTAAYYLWYADITGTKKMYFKGTPGFKFYVQFNRQAPEEGGDAHGGAMVQEELTIGEDGTATYDIPSSMTYVHLNCIKTKGITGTGVLKGMEIEGTVKPVTGILSMINNGDAEGDDLSSFPVSLDGPNNGGTANDKPEVVDGGVSGKCFKVTSVENPTESWHTQFYIKADETMAKGSKWKLKMSIKASENARITTSAQAEPRTWKGGMGIDEFGVSTEWQSYEWSGEIGVDDFKSIAFDLSNGDDEVSNTNGDGTVKVNHGISFYFDNIEFGYDLGGSNPLSAINVTAAADVVRIDLGGTTNMKELVKAAPTKTLIFDNSVASVTIGGEPVEIVSVEGFDDGNLYIFIDDDFYGDDEMKVAFKNPEDASHHLLFATGKWEGEAVPEISGLVATYVQALGDAGYESYLYGTPALVEISPEAGSFNLPADFKEFVVTFNQKIKVASVVAKLGNEPLTASGDEELTKVIKLTRTSTDALSGAKNLVISAAEGNAGSDFALKEKDAIVVKYSFGPVSADAKPETIYAANFTESGDNAAAAGWKVNADGGNTLQDANTGAGCRLQHGKSGFASDVLYLAQRSTPNGGVALYGIVEGYELALDAKEYHLTLDVAQWDAYENKRALKVQVLPLAAVDTESGAVIDETAVLAEDFKEVEPEFNNSKVY